MVLILTRSEITAVLRFDEVIDRVEQAHRALADGQATQATRPNVALPGSTALLIPMVAASVPHRAVGVKVMTDAPDNPPRGRPRQQSVVVLVDPDTGGCEAILDGAAITLMRTAAASAVATRHLANADGTTLGLVGAGRLASAHLKAIRHVRTVETVVVWSRAASTVRRFIDGVRAERVDVVVAGSPREVVQACDVLCTLTPSTDPIVHGDWLHAGMHVNVVGAPPRPSHREIDTRAVRRSRVVVDDLDVAWRESGAIVGALTAGVSQEHCGTELGQVVTGARAGRLDPTEITMYVSVGVGIQDAVTARLAVDIARDNGLGTNVDLTA